MHVRPPLIRLLGALLLAGAGLAAHAQRDRPWLDPNAPLESRVDTLVAAMTQDEKLTLVLGFGAIDEAAKQRDDIVDPAIKADVLASFIRGSAGYVPGIARLSVPGQWQTDSSTGVRVKGLERTSLPSTLLIAASFDPVVAETSGRMIGEESLASGFNVLLSGGANLAREPRNGRNFEYLGEDPWLAGTIGAAQVRGVQSAHVVSTMKHFAVNDQESQRLTLDATIAAAAMRQSDLLAFEILNEQGHPGSAMCSYNMINGQWGCENDYLLNQVLKHDWGFTGYVMSDWGAVHSTGPAIRNGLDMFTGMGCCAAESEFTPRTLKAALASGAIPPGRLDDMVRRIVRPMFENGLFEHPPVKRPIDFAADAAVALRAAEQSIVLLRNAGDLLPLTHVRSVAVIGGNADRGVPSGSGAAEVLPVGGNPVTEPQPVAPGKSRVVMYMPDAPLAALRRALPQAQVGFASGRDVAEAAALAAKADVAIVFVNQVAGEGYDTSLELQGGQDALVEAVAAANPKTVVVVQSGGAVLMPWRDKVRGIVAAFFPGIKGGTAIARVLTGAVNPSGHLPVTFPAAVAELPHPVIAGLGQPRDTPTTVVYGEGATIGYKWYDANALTPTWPFGHGLSYTRFVVSDIQAQADASGALTVRARVRNSGGRDGAAVVQAYVAPSAWRQAGWEAPKRLGGYAKVALRRDETRLVTMTIDPRLLATFQTSDNDWKIAAGDYAILLGQSSADLPLTATVTLAERRWSAVHAAARPAAAPATAKADGS